MNVVFAIIAVIALLALFLISITIFKYTIPNNFLRTRLVMSALFIFIVSTLSISFWPSALLTLPYTIPTFLCGAILGHMIGVRAERKKLTMLGAEHYVEHFTHIHFSDVKSLTWWSFVNYYSIMCGLILINLVGFTNIILGRSLVFVVLSSVVGAALIGSIFPYLVHLWTIPVPGKLTAPRKA
jgi:hypothetical protein